MFQASIYGRLGSDLREHQTKSCITMTTVNIAVDVTGNSEEETLWISVLAFNRLTDTFND